MRPVVFLALGLLLVAATVQAADVTTTAGSKAMVFQFSGLSSLGLGTYNGGVGVRYYLQDGMAIRPGIDFGMATHKIKGTGGNSDDKTTDMSVGVSVALEKHMTGPKSVSPYMGAGVGVGIANDKHEPSVPSTIPAHTVTKVTNKEMNFGLFGLLGFEWGFTESLTLGGEYRLGVNVGSGSTETERQGDATVKSNEVSNLGVGFSTASVYLSVGW